MVTGETYDSLKNLGTVTESFNDVIWRLIQKAVSGQQSFDGSAGQQQPDRYHQEAVTDK